MAGVTVDAVIVSVEARVKQYQADLEAAAKQTEAQFARMRKAASLPVTPKLGSGSGVATGAAEVEKAETRKQAARKKTAETEEQAAARIAAVVQRAVERDNAATANAERNAERRAKATNRELAAAQTRVMSGTALGSGTVAAGVDYVGRDRLDTEARLGVARAANDAAAKAALQDQLFELKLIDGYKKAGLTESEAAIRAEARLAEITKARALTEAQANRQKIEANLRQNSGAVSSGIGVAVPALVGGLTLAGISSLNDKFIEFTNRLKIAGVEGDNLKTVQDALFGSAQKYGVELGSLGDIFNKATQAGHSFGATQNDNLKFTNAIAAAVKVQGGSVSDARGALLQLGQALESGTVRAQEFNSIQQGLYPLLQAAASASDKYGGSVAKLKAAQVAGNLTSKEFYDLILKGSDILEQRAAKATLTTAAGFATLTNALVVYFGEADKANGVSAAFGTALKVLADNLNLVIPAIAAITVALGVGYVTAALAAGTATKGFGVALAFIEANPVVIALSALAGVIAFVALRSGEATTATAKLTDGQKALNQVLTSDAAARAAKDTDALSAARANLTVQTLRAAKAEVDLQIAQAKRAADLASRGKRLETTTTYRAEGRTRVPVTTTEEVDLSDRVARGSDGTSELGRARKAAGQQVASALEAAKAYQSAAKDYIKGVGQVKSTPGAAIPAKTTAASGRTGPDPVKAAQRAADQQAQDEKQATASQIEILRAQSDLADGIEERAEFQQQIFDLERKQANADVNNDRTLTDANRKAALARIAKLYGSVTADDGGITVTTPGLKERKDRQDKQRALDRQADDVAKTQYDIQRNILQAAADEALTREARVKAQTDLLNLELEEKRRALEAQKKQTNDPVELQRIDGQLGALDGEKARGQTDIQRNNESPFQTRARQLNSTSTEDQVQSLVLDELDQVQAGIAGALEKVIGTKDPLISGLINLLVQNVIIKPLTDALANSKIGGGSGSGIFGSVISAGLSLFGGGRASGGDVTAGRIYRVNENGPEYFSPAQSGKIIPTGAVKTSSGGGGTVQQTFVLDNRGGITTPQLIDYINKTARTQAVSAASASARGVYQAIPSRISEYQKDGI